MSKEELYLKTVFCCIACDGEISIEEIELVRAMCKENNHFTNIDAENCLNAWVSEINEQGGMFLQKYLKEINLAELNEKEQLLLASFAIKAIEADNRMEYAEVKFFKKIRSKLTVSDDAILTEHPDKEHFILPDINLTEIPQWNDSTHFAQISIPIQNN